ncbi:STAS domain-containing protein [Streptomyces sp. NPDC001185]|uniref:STAS domain-containing protein n=1 Tax=Streptomyces sp. NPDC001185 TaxID=3154380 RepID=UPI003320B2E7
MILTVTDAGVTAVFSPRGEIGFDTLPGVLARAQEVPHTATGVTWDLRQARFVDVAGLHLLIHQRLACQDTGRILTVVSLQQQPKRLLDLAWELFPDNHWDDFLPGGLLAAAY